MAKLFGRNYTQETLRQHVGELSQLAGVRLGELGDGFERGVRTADVRTGSGFDFTVLLDRGMDIGWASYKGAPIAWRSHTSAIGPAFYEPHGTGWLRGFHGGMMNTCGLTTFGSPSRDEGEELGQHGRASYIPAHQVAHGGEWHGDDYEIWVSGRLRQATVFGENLVLSRRISARLGESRLVVEDTVTNEGYQPTPHMILYHVNFGFPVLTAESELLTASEEVSPRDEAAKPGIDAYSRFQEPTAGYHEQVFYHKLKRDADGYVQAAVANRGFNGGQGLGGYVRFRAAELPTLIQWKMMGQGTYVCGLEPASNLVEGRDKERREGRLRLLSPGERREYRVEIGVLGSQAEIDAFAEALSAL